MYGLGDDSPAAHAQSETYRAIIETLNMEKAELTEKYEAMAREYDFLRDKYIVLTEKYIALKAGQSGTV